MAVPIVLVIFYSRSGQTERLALSHGVGAVQGRALIRLRRIAETNLEQTIADHRQHEAELRRMQKEYVAPTEADVLAADALVLSPPQDADPGSPEWRDFLSLLRRLAAEGRLRTKIGAVVNTGGGRWGAMAHFTGALFGCGLILVPPAPDGDDSPPAATAHGRRVATVAAALKPVLAAQT